MDEMIITALRDWIIEHGIKGFSYLKFVEGKLCDTGTILAEVDNSYYAVFSKSSVIKIKHISEIAETFILFETREIMNDWIEANKITKGENNG